MTSIQSRLRAQIRNRDVSNRRGAATVEFALTLPIAFLLFFGAIEMTRLNSARNTADNAAYEGARRAIVPGAIKSHVDKEAWSILSAGSIRQATITMDPAVIDTSTERVTVTVALKMNQNSWVAPVYSKDLTIRRSCTLSREQALGTGTAVASPTPTPIPDPPPKPDPKDKDDKDKDDKDKDDKDKDKDDKDKDDKDKGDKDKGDKDKGDKDKGKGKKGG